MTICKPKKKKIQENLRQLSHVFSKEKIPAELFEINRHAPTTLYSNPQNY